MGKWGPVEKIVENLFSTTKKKKMFFLVIFKNIRIFYLQIFLKNVYSKFVPIPYKTLSIIAIKFDKRKQQINRIQKIIIIIRGIFELSTMFLSCGIVDC